MITPKLSGDIYSAFLAALRERAVIAREHKDAQEERRAKEQWDDLQWIQHQLAGYERLQRDGDRLDHSQRDLYRRLFERRAQLMMMDDIIARERGSTALLDCHSDAFKAELDRRRNK